MDRRDRKWRSARRSPPWLPVERLDIFQHVAEGDSGRADLLGCEAVEHESVIGIRTVRADDLEGSDRGHMLYNSSSLQQCGSLPADRKRKEGEKVKGRPSSRHVRWKRRWRSSDLRITRRAANRPHENPIAQNFQLPYSPAADEAALVVARFYRFHLPPAPVGRPSNFSFTPAGMLVNDIEGLVRLSTLLRNYGDIFRSLGGAGGAACTRWRPARRDATSFAGPRAGGTACPPQDA